MSRIANIEQFEAWNGDSGRRWVDDSSHREKVLGPFADLLLDRARPRPGERVLDVGCGCGPTTRAAAGAVGPTGRVVGLDLSAPMLDQGRSDASAEGLANVEFVQGDAQTHDLGETFDLVISRFGTMFFGDPVAAFTNLARHVGVDGRLCMLTWQPLATNPWMTVPLAALEGFGAPPEIDASLPGMFGLSETQRIGTVMAEAGWARVEVEPVLVAMELGVDAAGAAQYLAQTGVARVVMEALDPDRREAALAALADAMEPRAGPGGVSLDGAVWVTTARRR